ncbi:WXG100 family type VII secretion target [Amycolatopsis thermophila]|uniref:Uncharacterized protein YukE n=1 Tax=Amycolatopsis thermophila TaxID=206084 RepID=A0ABU0END5_9PSEU|nr:hypothetical protein [Amycolatopsis thermophila]MDQ0376803.1 uncharacterized protein YukE [Amycolatopsis thermophila]
MSEYKPGDVGLHMAEKWQTGAGFFDAAVSLNEAVKENDKVAVGIGSAGLALETLGLALDPIGSLLTAGIGWLIEHISVLRWPLDIMWGDPEGIQAAEEAVKAEKAKLEQWAQDHQTKLATLMESWSGEGADQFRKSMEAVTDQLNAIGGYLENAGKSMKVAGGLVGAFRGIARDLIAMLLATIIKGALIAAALAPVTFGASIAFFIGTTIGMVATALGKIGAKIAELTRKLVDLGASLAKLGKAGDDLAGAKPPSVKPGASGPAPTNTGAPVSGGPKLTEPPASVVAGPRPADAPAVSGGPKLTEPPASVVAGPRPADAPPVSGGPKLTEPPASVVAGPRPADAPPVSGGPKLTEPPASVVAGPRPADAPAVSGGPKLNEPPASVVAGPRPADAPPVSAPPKVDDAVTTQSAPPKPADAPPVSPVPKLDEPADPAPGTPVPPPADPAPGSPKPTGSTPAPSKPADPAPGSPKPTDDTPASPKPADQSQPGGPKPTDQAGHDPKTHHRLSEQMSQAIKNELSKIEGVTPETLAKFDKISNFSVAQLGKLFGTEGAEKFEQAIKFMTDPWFGYRGLAGKTIIDMIKGVPTSVGNVTGGDDE